jgi:hypothetical protein
VDVRAACGAASPRRTGVGGAGEARRAAPHSPSSRRLVAGMTEWLWVLSCRAAAVGMRMRVARVAGVGEWVGRELLLFGCGLLGRRGCGVPLWVVG